MKSYVTRLFMSITLTIAAMIISFSCVYAQKTTFRDQAWRYGITGALQYNSASLGWQTLHGNQDNFHSPENNIDRVDGNGFGAYGGIFGAYLSESWWGLELRVCYDERNALVVDDTRLPQPSFDTRMNYLSFALSFRIDQHLVPNLYLHLGPFINANLSGNYYYKADKNQDDADEELFEVSKRNIATYGIQGGLGYDFRLAEINSNSAMYLTPFFDMSWLVNQRKSEGQPSQNSITDIWSTLSYRVGLKFSLDYIKNIKKEIYLSDIPPSIKRTDNVIVEMPTDNIILTKNVKGYFPIIPYVFFNKQSQAIPSRYKLLSKQDASNFKESDLENFMAGELSTKETNIDQLMRAYYNLINIFGDRMRNNPKEDLVLIGSDPEDFDALLSANAIKMYLVDNFGINANRIKIEVEPPNKPSGSFYTEESSKSLIDDENRRVRFAFNNPDMLKPVEYTIRDESSIDNDMFFSIKYGVDFKSWDMTISGEGKTMYFGPYQSSYARINPAELMRFLESGKYNANIVITHQNGIKTDENVVFKLTKNREIKNASRYLMLFDYNSKDAIRSFEKIIRKEIVPGIISESKVYVHGHTDNIGTAEGNLKLSQERANEVKSIIDDQLTKENRKANITTIGVGQNKVQYSFDNIYPEGRMYNRNIFVETFK